MASAATSSTKGAADEWIGRVRDFVNKPNVVTDKAPEQHQEWHFRMFGCFSPIDTCFITWCCPCITFGKTHHRLRGDPNLTNYSMVNGSCLIWLASAFVGLPCFLNCLQRHEIRSRFSLTGDGVADCLRGWCCHCCDLIQQDKEAEYHLLNGSPDTNVINEQPEKQAETMAYPPPAPQQ